ncbi:MAG: ABC transporter permease [Aquihabitans sp.]
MIRIADGLLRRSITTDAARTLLARPWRTLASAIGVLVGVASGVVTLALASSQQAQVDQNFDRQLSPVVILEAQPTTAPRNVGPDATELLRPQLAEIPGRQVGGELSTWRRTAVLSTSSVDPGRTVSVFGAGPGALQAAGAHALTGSIQALGAEAAAHPLAWIGIDAARTAGLDRASLPGAALLVDGAPVSVAGVISEGTRFPALGRSVILSPAAARSIWGAPEQERIVVEVRRGSARSVARHLMVGLDPSGQHPLLDATPPDGAVTRQAVGSDLRRAGLSFSAVALVIGVVSVAGAMTTSVIQRTREIGLRAALGWTPMRIARLVVTESMGLAAFASVIGTAAGLAVAAEVCARNRWPFVVPTFAAWMPTLLGVAAGGIGGAAPSLRAGRISPTEALRG